MTQLVQTLIESDAFVWVILAASVVLIVTVKSIASVLSTNARERSRREIAAYIAEGSMTPDQGERLMKACEPDRA